CHTSSCESYYSSWMSSFYPPFCVRPKERPKRSKCLEGTFSAFPAYYFQTTSGTPYHSRSGSLRRKLGDDGGALLTGQKENPCQGGRYDTQGGKDSCPPFTYSGGYGHFY